MQQVIFLATVVDRAALKAHADAVLTARLGYAERGWWTFPAPVEGDELKKGLKSAEFSNGVRWGAPWASPLTQRGGSHGLVASRGPSATLRQPTGGGGAIAASYRTLPE